MALNSMIICSALLIETISVSLGGRCKNGQICFVRIKYFEAYNDKKLQHFRFYVAKEFIDMIR